MERGRGVRRAESTKQCIDSDSVGQDWAVDGLPVEELLESHVIVVLYRDGPPGGHTEGRWVTSRRAGVTPSADSKTAHRSNDACSRANR